MPRLYTEFKAIWFVMGQHGGEDELRMTCEYVIEGRGNGMRSAANLDWGQPPKRNPSYPLVQFNARMPGYLAARQRTAEILAEYELYWEMPWGCDLQRIYPNPQERWTAFNEWIDFVLTQPHIIPQLANEPFKNGWTGADDPEFLRYGRHLVSRMDGRTCSLGDPMDVVTNLATAEPLASEWEAVARAGGPTSYLVLHPERKMPDARYAGWLDHLRGADEVLNPFLKPRLGWGFRPAYVADEPKGGSFDWQPGRRDNRPMAHFVGQCIGAMLGGYTYLSRSEEEPAGLVAGTPGWLAGAVTADIPGSPDFEFYNVGAGRSPVRTFAGWGNGKIRTMSNGREGWAIAYGTPGTLTWHSGYVPVLVKEMRDGGNIAQLWKATR